MGFAHTRDHAVESLERALAVFPAERWQTAGSFWGALREALELSAAPDMARVPRPAPRSAPAVALLLAAALAASSLVDGVAAKACSEAGTGSDLASNRSDPDGPGHSRP